MKLIVNIQMVQVCINQTIKSIAHVSPMFWRWNEQNTKKILLKGNYPKVGYACTEILYFQMKYSLRGKEKLSGWIVHSLHSLGNDMVETGLGVDSKPIKRIA